jgi:hypothetical protein
MLIISDSHKQRFEEMRKIILETGSKETTFSKIEQLFYEAMNISRSYGNDVSENKLLALFKKIEAEQYQMTTTLFKKGSKREQAIKRFTNQFKSVLNKATKNLVE